MSEIHRRTFLGVAGAGLLGAAAPRKPNIVLIVADDVGMAGVSSYYNEQARTPHIDSIAREGVRFLQSYATASLCSPSRAGLITGRYQQRFGHEFNIGSPLRDLDQGLGLPLSEVTLADVLKENGYATAAIGKWHLGNRPQFHPNRRGYDEFFGFRAAMRSYLRPVTPDVVVGPFTKTDKLRDLNVFDNAAPLMRNQAIVNEPAYTTHAFTRESLSFIERHKDHPFFLHLSYNAAHLPLQALRKYYDRFPHVADENSRVYQALGSAMDDGIGLILDKLRTTGLEKDTLVIFTSDNGCPTYVDPRGNGPLKQGKATYFEGGIRVPLMMRYPGRISPGSTYKNPVISLDIFPTVTTAAGIRHTRSKLDGVDLLPFLRGASTGVPHEVLYWRAGSQHAIRYGNWKYYTAAPAMKRLYDLSEDQGEKKNFFAQRSDMVVRLDSEWKNWNSKLVEPRWKSARTTPEMDELTDDGEKFQVEY
jgi:arylsulfatase A-like enzyme